MRLDTKEKRIAAREYYIPKGAQKVAMKDGGAVFYLFANKDGLPCARCFIGTSAKPAWAYRFSSEAARAKRIEEQISVIRSRAAEDAARRAERNKAHTLEKGLILYTSWGYDQTNTEFFEVIDVPSKNFVVLQEISAPLVNGEDSFMSGKRMPDPERRIGEPFRRKVSMNGRSPSVRIDSVRTAWVWDGREKRVSWYA